MGGHSQVCTERIEKVQDLLSPVEASTLWDPGGPI